MGIIPLFDRAKLTPFFYGKFILIIKPSLGLKYLKLLNIVQGSLSLLKQFLFLMILLKRSSKTIMKCNLSKKREENIKNY